MTEPIDPQNDLFAAHEAMAKVLDEKWSRLGEWQAFRAIDRALLSTLRTAHATTPKPKVERVQSRRSVDAQGVIRNNAPTPYMTLAAQALDETSQPISTVDLMDYIGRHREITGDPKKARIVVQSSLSKDERFRSIPWEGGRAWWWAHQPVPKKETAA